MTSIIRLHWRATVFLGGFLAAATAFGGTLSVLHTCAGGDDAHPGSLLLGGDTLYGATLGDYENNTAVPSIFSLGTNGLNYTVLHTFDHSAYPAGMVLSGSNLYGVTTSDEGTNLGSVFSLDANGSNFTTIYSFQATDKDGGMTNGAYPTSTPVIVGSTIYGVTSQGGAAGNGVLYSVGLDGSNFRVLHSFTTNDGGDALGGILVAGDTVYGTTYGTIFAAALDGSSVKVLYQIPVLEFSTSAPQGLVLDGDTLLSPSTVLGHYLDGAIFAVKTNGATSGYAWHTFLPTGPHYPASGLTAANGLYYGSTSAGGSVSNDSGSIYSVSTDGKTYATLYSFPPASGTPETNELGASPAGPLVVADGIIYGTAPSGGSNGFGTIFFAPVGGGSSGSNGSLTIVTNGSGGVLVRGSTSKIGSQVTLTAKPAAGWLFENWTGGVSTNRNPLTLTVAAGDSIQANFVTNPFPALAGAYNGLFDPGLYAGHEPRGSDGGVPRSAAVVMVTSGMLKNLKVSAVGAYSGQLLFAGGTYPLAGLFDPAAQTASELVKVPAAAGGPLELQMNLTGGNAGSFGGGLAYIYGQVAGSGGAWSSALQAYGNAKTGAVGQYTLLLPPDTNNNPPVSSPGGTGYVVASTSAGSSAVAPSAAVTGLLADGASFTQSAPLNVLGQIPLYASLYHGAGVILGWVPVSPEAGGTEEVFWISAARAGADYASGFTNRYYLPTPGFLVGAWTNSPSNYTVWQSAILPSRTNAISINSAGKITGIGITGSVNPKTGVWKVTSGSGKNQVTATGAIVTASTNIAAGFSLQDKQSLPAALAP